MALPLPGGGALQATMVKKPGCLCPRCRLVAGAGGCWSRRHGPRCACAGSDGLQQARPLLRLGLLEVETTTKGGSRMAALRSAHCSRAAGASRVHLGLDGHDGAWCAPVDLSGL
jgi:hypothetical protein